MGGPAPAAGSAAPAVTAPVSPPAPPVDPVPLAVQPPPPVAAGPATPPPAPGGFPPAAGDPGAAPFGGATGGDGGTAAVLADTPKRTNRAVVIALVVALVLVLGGGAYYVISKRNSPSTPTVAAPPSGQPSPAADTALAGTINVRLSDLPTGWTAAPPAQAVVRPPVAPVAAQSDATNTMAACLNTSASVVAGLFGSGPLPNQTSMVPSSTFQSPTGAAMEMSSKTMTLASPGQVQALDAIFTNPKFDLCYQQYAGSLAAGAVTGATVQVQPVTLTGPAGVQTYGVITTYALPGNGTQVVGDAYMLGGRVVTVLQPSTNGPAIPGEVFTPAYDAVVARVAAAATK